MSRDALEIGSSDEQAHRNQVFVSYAREDIELARRLVRALERNGYKVWWDQTLKGGEAYAREIRDAIQRSQHTIVLWSKSSIQSDWVLDEAGLARDLGKLLPVRIDNSAAPLGFGQYHVVDLSGWDGKPETLIFDEILSTLTHSRSGAKALVLPPFSRRQIIVGAGAGTVTLAGGAAIVGGLRLFGAARAPDSVAVLPFDNATGDPAQSYIPEGLCEELISALARLGSLQVAGKTSSFRFRGSSETTSEIGAKLGVSHLISGSVRQGDAILRFNVHLIDAKTGFERWAETFNSPHDNILTVQSQIAETVATEIVGKIAPKDRAALGTGRPASAAAYDLYLKGRKTFDEGRDGAQYREALTNFDAAIAADRQFALARTMRARTLLTLADEFMDGENHQMAYDQALDEANGAAALAPTLPEVQATLADTIVTTRLDVPAAAKAYDLALQTGSGNADVLVRYGLFSCCLGNFKAGLAALQKSAMLDPLNPRVFKSLGIGQTLFGDLKVAEIALRRALSLSPDLHGVHARLGDIRYLQGQYADAQIEYGLEPVAWERLTGMAMIYNRLKNAAAAEAAVAALKSLPDTLTPYQLAQIHAQAGRTKLAIDALNEAFKTLDSGVINLRTDPLLKPLRGEPGFESLSKRLGS